jgi:hypothetical protein
VDVVALCLAPPMGPADHLGAASRFGVTLSRAFRDDEFCRALRQAKSGPEVAAVVWARDGGMTRRDWLASNDPIAMLGCLQDCGGLSERKARLFACACCRRLWHRLEPAPDRHAVEVAERFADGLASAAELADARAAADRIANWGRLGPVGPLFEAGWFVDPYGGAAACADDPDAPAALALAAVQERAEDVLALCLPWATALGLTPAAQADLLRDIAAGPPGTAEKRER